MSLIDLVIDAVAQRCHVTAEEIRGPRRTRHIANARHLVCLILRRQSAISLHVIGEGLGGRDHTTVMHAAAAAEQLIAADASLAWVVADVERQLSVGVNR